MRPAMILLTAMLLTVTTAAVPDAVAAQAVATVAQGAPNVLVAQAQDASAVAQQPIQPRSMRPYWHVFLAFALVWLLLFGYALTVGRRFGRLEEEVRRLRSLP
jgi:CcmD family protein